MSREDEEKMGVMRLIYNLRPEGGDAGDDFGGDYHEEEDEISSFLSG